MHDLILDKLTQIEREQEVTILFACEWGSRALGLSSPTSDYDVRFVYARPAEWYLSLFPGRDVIELPLSPDFDINGWDVSKALRLLRKSNVSLLEWLTSPIQYRNREDLTSHFRSAVSMGFNPVNSARHYLSIAKRNFGKTDREETRVKIYLNTLRPLLCCRWLLEQGTQPPINFRELVATQLGGTPFAIDLNRLIDLKISKKEIDWSPKNSSLDEFIAAQFEQLAAGCQAETPLPDLPAFDRVFREIIARV